MFLPRLKARATALLGFSHGTMQLMNLEGNYILSPGKCIGFLATCVFKVVRSTSLAWEQPISTKPRGATSAQEIKQQTRPGTHSLLSVAASTF